MRRSRRSSPQLSLENGLLFHNSQFDNNENEVGIYIDVAPEDKTPCPDLAIVVLDIPSYRRVWSPRTTIRATIALFVVVVHAAVIMDDDVTPGRKYR